METGAQRQFKETPAPGWEPKPQVIAGGSALGSVAGVAAIALGILALVGVYPALFMSIAAICAGGALLFEGAALSARFARYLAETSHGTITIADVGGGLTTEFAGGIAGVTLGILALVGIAPAVLVPAAVIAMGGALLAGSFLTARINAAIIESGGRGEPFSGIAGEIRLAASGVQGLCGAAAVALGILALIGFVPAVLSLIGLIAIGFAAAMNGSALSASIMRIVNR